MYDPKKEFLQHFVYLSVLLFLGIFLILTCFHPRTTNVDEKDLSRSTNIDYNNLPIMPWPPENYRKQICEKEQDVKQLNSSTKMCTTIASHTNNIITGRLICYSIYKDGLTQTIREYSNIPFKIIDTMTPALIKSEVRRYDIIHSKVFKTLYIYPL